MIIPAPKTQPHTSQKAADLKDKYEPFIPMTEMSRIGLEFGIENHSGSLNCFLNVCLQALWQCPMVR
jgi:hypothetical protein